MFGLSWNWLIHPFCRPAGKEDGVASLSNVHRTSKTAQKSVVPTPILFVNFHLYLSCDSMSQSCWERRRIGASEQ
jgi:hypothetical protein